LFRICCLAVSLACSATTALAEAAEHPCQSCSRCVEDFLGTLEGHGWLGMAVHLHKEAGDGSVEIQFLDDAGPAARSGLRRGDRITRIGELDIEGASTEQIAKRLFEIRSGEEVLFGIERSGRSFEVSVRAEDMSVRAKAEALGTFLLRRLRELPPAEPDSSPAERPHESS